MQIISLVFAGLILLGALLLTLPIASRSGMGSDFLTALFTATSATCVTGLVVADTWSQWSGFGQAVILLLIEVGGLGFMSAAALVVFLLRKKVGLRQRMLMAQALSVNEMSGVVRLQKWVLVGSLGIQLAGALILFIRFAPEYGLGRGAWWGLFHAVSAFCNGGFDVLGSLEPGAGLMLFQDDPIVLLTLMALIVLGGLGFFVWEEVIRLRSLKKCSVYTKLVLLTTLTLILGGAAVIGLLEWNNPQTLGQMPWWQKILNAGFQAVTLRTAGFAALPQGALTEAGRVFSILLMLVGGSSGSTAGGMKTVTVLVLFLFIFTRARGRRTVQVFRHTIPEEKVLDAVTVVVALVGLSLLGGIVISVLCPVSFLDALFEAASAISTAGLTTGITPLLTVPAKLLVIVYMYFGRVGVLTLSLGFLMGDKAVERIRYADTNLLIG